MAGAGYDDGVGAWVGVRFVGTPIKSLFIYAAVKFILRNFLAEIGDHAQDSRPH